MYNGLDTGKIRMFNGVYVLWSSLHEHGHFIKLLGCKIITVQYICDSHILNQLILTTFYGSSIVKPFYHYPFIMQEMNL